jgi:hypothetical protein
LSNSSSPEFQVPQIYFPDPPKLWSRERLTGVIATDSKERNDFIATQWLHLRIHSTARIDDESTKEGKMWISGLKALAKWYQGDPSVRWGRVVEVDRRERGEVVVVCGAFPPIFVYRYSFESAPSKAYLELGKSDHTDEEDRPTIRSLAQCVRTVQGLCGILGDYQSPLDGETEGLLSTWEHRKQDGPRVDYRRILSNPSL